MVDSKQDENSTTPPDETAAYDQAKPQSAEAQGEDAVAAGGLASEVAAANERALRAQAELENYRKRARRELADSERYATMPLLRDLLGVLDDLNRAIEAAEKSSDGAGLLEGVRLVQKHLSEVLANHGCHSVEAAGEEFDPAVHEAILQQPSDQHPPGSVMHVAKEGYRLHDRVIRPAQVIVAAKPERD